MGQVLRGVARVFNDWLRVSPQPGGSTQTHRVDRDGQGPAADVSTQWGQRGRFSRKRPDPGPARGVLSAGRRARGGEQVGRGDVASVGRTLGPAEVPAPGAPAVHGGPSSFPPSTWFAVCPTVHLVRCVSSRRTCGAQAGRGVEACGGGSRRQACSCPLGATVKSSRKEIETVTVVVTRRGVGRDPRERHSRRVRVRGRWEAESSAGLCT